MYLQNKSERQGLQVAEIKESLDFVKVAGNAGKSKPI